MSNPDDAPKLIIDDDWKSSAQAEKERLAEADAARKPARGKGPASAAGGGGAGKAGESQAGQAGEPAELPPADLLALVGMLATQALMSLGGMADPRTGQAVFDPEMAKYYIDLLAMLEAKTKGNLNEEETRELQGALHELRLRFVELIQMVAKQAVQSGQISPEALKAMSGGAMPGGMAGGMPGGLVS